MEKVCFRLGLLLFIPLYLSLLPCGILWGLFTKPFAEVVAEITGHFDRFKAIWNGGEVCKVEPTKVESTEIVAEKSDESENNT